MISIFSLSRYCRIVFFYACLALLFYLKASGSEWNFTGLVLPTAAYIDQARWRQLTSSTNTERLAQLVQISDDELDQFLSSDDPIQRAVGVFVASYRGDFTRLWNARSLLSDERQTLPCLATGTGSSAGVVPEKEQTVGEYTAHVFGSWFGISVASTEHFEKKFPNVTDPKTLIRPWVYALTRHQNVYSDQGKAIAAQRIPVIKSQIAELPESLRWAVITECYRSKSYTRDEAIEALRPLKHLRTNMPTGNTPIAGDPTFRADSTMGKRIIDAFMELTEEP